MRFVGGMALIAHGIETFHNPQPIGATILHLLAVADGALLIAGLWTPITASAAAILALSSAIGGHQNLYACILLATIGGALALLGPGAWSLDARLFGWKRIDI